MRHVAPAIEKDDLFMASPAYAIYGPYSVAKENDFLVRNFVDQVGANIAATYYQWWTSSWVGKFFDAQAPVGSGIGGPQRTTTGICPSYNWNYHDWT